MKPCERPTFKKVCPCCGKEHDGFEWVSLLYIGIQEMNGVRYELRNCACGSTLALPLEDGDGK